MKLWFSNSRAQGGLGGDHGERSELPSGCPTCRWRGVRAGTQQGGRYGHCLQPIRDYQAGEDAGRQDPREEKTNQECG